MTPRTFTILGIVAVISVTAATLALGMRPQFLEFRADGERVFPSLLENADQVASFQVRQGNDQMTFVHGDKGWVLSESGGYAIDNRLAAKVILSLASLEFLEAKTKRKEKLAKLRLEDPLSEKSQARLLTFVDKNDKEIANLILGRDNYSLPATMTGGIYIRRPNEDQAWLAKGTVDIGGEPRDWLVRKIIDIPLEQIKHVRFSHPDGETFTIVGDLSVKDGFKLESVPEGMKLKTSYGPRSIANVVNNFLLNDVRRQTELTLTDTEASVSEFTLVNGDVVKLELWDKKPRNWMRVIVSGESQQAAAIAKRTEGWVYDIPDYQAELLRKRFTELTKAEKPAS